MPKSESQRIPPPTSVIEVGLDENLSVPVRRYGNPDGPRLLISHGNGLAINLYHPYWSILLDEFDLIIFDLRNHGENPLDDIARHTVPAVSRDLEVVGQAVNQAFGVRPKAGVFHSLSCLAAVLSLSLGATYSALVLFDPPFYLEGIGQRIFESSCRQAAARTRIRAGRFSSEHDFVELMKSQPAMSRVLPGVCESMAETTLRKTADGSYELSCPPEYEAQILASAPSFSRLVDPDSLSLPVKVIGADPGLEHYFLPPCDLNGAKSTDFEFLPGTTHLAQLEKPDECARLTMDFLRRTGFSQS